MEDTIITYHAEDRIKERAGIPKRSADNFAQKALERGLKHGDLTGNLKKYVDGLYFKNKQANNVRIYGHKVFIFHDVKLITVMNLPKNLIKIADKINKNRKAGE